MGSVYRPSYTTPDGKRKKSLTYRIAYVNEHGKRVSVAGYKDKKASHEKLRRIEERVDRIRSGLPVPQESAAAQPWSEALQLYLAEMRRLGRSGAYVTEVERALTSLVATLGWTDLRMVHREPVLRYLGQLAEIGRSPRTVNHYRDTLATFCTFAVQQGWLPSNPIASIPKASLGSPGDVSRRPRARRALTLDEFAALVSIPSPRTLLYRIAAFSGLRRLELFQLEKQDATFTPRPTWQLRPEITKGRRLDVVQMTPDCVEAFRSLWEAAVSPTDRMFPRSVNHRTFNNDLRRAGIERFDHRNRRATFHSLRYFFCVRMGLVLPIQRVRLLMRHRDIRTTCNLYMDLGIADVAEAFAELPRVVPQKGEQAGA